LFLQRKGQATENNQQFESLVAVFLSAHVNAAQNG